MAGTMLSASDKLMTAACSGSTEIVLQLLGNSSTLDSDENGYTVLHYAAANGHVKLVSSLVERGFKVDSRDNLGYTALHLAASQGHVEVVRTLLMVSQSVNSQDRVHGNTAVHEAAWNGYSQTLQELVMAKANVNAINNAGFSALHLAAQNGHNESSRVLLFAGCSPDHKNSYGDTPLHTAARYSHAGVTRILISAKCNVNEINKNGDTALHIATALKQKKITKLLLEANVDLSVINNQRETALDIARRKDFEELVALLSSFQLSSSRKQTKPSSSGDAAPLERVMPPAAAAATALSDKKKWTSIFKKNKSKDRGRAGQSNQYNGDSTYEEPKDVPFQISNEPRITRDVLRDFQQYQMQKRQHLHAPGPMLPGMAGHCPPPQAVQYYRDLAGNIKQGPFGYVPTSGTMSNWPPPILPFHRHAQPNVADVSYLKPSQCAQHDHLSYLRSRQPPRSSRPVMHPFMPPRMSSGTPVYVDQSGRPWPMLHPSMMLHNPPRGAFPGHGQLEVHDARGQMDMPSVGQPIYRSRSDETLSTISSRPSCRKHRVANGRSTHRKVDKNCPHAVAAPSGAEQQPFFVGTAVAEPSGSQPTNTTTQPAGTVPPSKSLSMDSHSNPDSGYGGASGMVARQLAPCSESSSLHSASSSEVVTNPKLGSSCRTDSMPSLCNSL